MPARFPFRDTSLSLDKRVDDLMGRLTVEEKISTAGRKKIVIDSMRSGNRGRTMFIILTR